MEHVIVAALLIALIALLVSRIHFHFSFNLTVSRRGSQPGPEQVRPVAPAEPKRGKRVETVPPADLVSALVNLGCEKKRAVQVATQAMDAGDFDAQLRKAIKLAA